MSLQNMKKVEHPNSVAVEINLQQGPLSYKTAYCCRCHYSAHLNVGLYHWLKELHGEKETIRNLFLIAAEGQHTK